VTACFFLPSFPSERSSWIPGGVFPAPYSRATPDVAGASERARKRLPGAIAPPSSLPAPMRPQVCVVTVHDAQTYNDRERPPEAESPVPNPALVRLRPDRRALARRDRVSAEGEPDSPRNESEGRRGPGTYDSLLLMERRTVRPPSEARKHHRHHRVSRQRGADAGRRDARSGGSAEPEIQLRIMLSRARAAGPPLLEGVRQHRLSKPVS
jgi:hypothetical protein